MGLLTSTPSLSAIVPRMQRRLCIIALVSYACFTGVSTYHVVLSPLTLAE